MPAPDLEQSCAFLIHDTARLIRRRLGLSIRDLELTQAQWRVLANLLLTPGCTQSGLAETLDMEKAPLGHVLDRLEQAGWVKREPDPADRRARRVYLTPKADNVISDIMRIGLKLRGEALAGISDADLESFFRVLEVILANLAAAPSE